MTGKATLVISSDTKDGEKAIQHLVKEMQKIREENKKLKEENKKAAEEAKQQAKEQAEAHRKKIQQIKEEQKSHAEANRKLVQAAKEQEKVQREAAKEIEKREREQLRLSEQKSAAWLTFGRSIAVSAGAYVSLNTVLEETNKMLARQSELQQQINQHTVAAGRSQQDTILSMQGVTDAQRARAIQGAKDINLRTGFGNVNAINAAYGKALSASEGNFGKAEGAVEAAAALAAGDPAKLDAYTQAALDVGLPAGKSGEESLGLVLSGGSQARITDPKQAAQFFAKMAASGAALYEPTGGDVAEAARQRVVLGATITSGIKDPTGEVSKTAAINLGAKLAEFFKGRPGDPGTEAGRIEALWADKGLAQQFDAKYNFEAESNDFINALLGDRNSAAAQTYRRFNKAIGWDRSAYEASRKATLDASPQTRALMRENQRQSIAQAGMDMVTPRGLVEEAEQLHKQSIDILEGVLPGQTRAQDSIFNAESWNTWLHDAINADPVRRAEHRQRLLRKRFNDMVHGRLGGQPPVGPDNKLVPDYYERFQEEGVAGIESTYFGQPVPRERQEAAALMARQVEQSERIIQELQEMNANNRKPVVSTQGLQEAN